ncbi:MAG: hypothetical protein SGI71_03070 [Verrucomicrobiota bacterium]|nr:hypothetical protein [Verrucomicrobiota bacterium]
MKTSSLVLLLAIATIVTFFSYSPAKADVKVYIGSGGGQRHYRHHDYYAPRRHYHSHCEPAPVIYYPAPVVIVRRAPVYYYPSTRVYEYRSSARPGYYYERRNDDFRY